MDRPVILRDGQRLVDLHALHAALSDERFAGVRLVEPVRSNLIGLVSHLAGREPITAEALLRYLPPLLEGLAENVAEFRRALHATIDRMTRAELSPQPIAPEVPEPTGGVVRLLRHRRRWPLILAALVVGALFIMLVWQPTSTKAPAPAPTTSAPSNPGTPPKKTSATDHHRPEAKPQPLHTPRPRQTLTSSDGVRLTPARRAPATGIFGVTLESVDSRATWTLAVILFVIALAAMLDRVRRSPLALERFSAGRETPKVTLPSAGQRSGLDARWMREWRELLGRPTPGDPQFSLEATILSTVANGGLATPEYRLRRAFPSFTAIVERDSRRDCLADWWLRVMDAVASSGVHLQIGSVRSTSNAPVRSIGRGLTAALQDPFPNSRLLVFGEPGAHLLGAERSTWSVGDIPALFASPVAGIAMRARPGAGLERDLDRAAGKLALLSGYLDADPRSDALLFDADRNWLDETPLSDAQWQQLKGALILRLAPSGYRWLSGCAIFPVIEERLAWRVAQALQISLDPALLRQDAVRLFATPWMRAGRFPRWLRDRLTGDLDTDDVAALHAMLLTHLGDRETHTDLLDQDAAIVGHEAKTIDLEDSLLARFVIAPPGLTALSPGQLPPHLRKWLLPDVRGRISQLSSLRRNPLPVALAICAALLVLPFAPGIDLMLAAAWSSVCLLSLLTVRARAPARPLSAMLRRTFHSAAAAVSAVGKLRFSSPPVAADSRVLAGRRLATAHVRVTMLALLFLAATGSIIARLVFLGFAGPSSGASETTNAPIQRGEITDRNGSLLASTIGSWSIAVRPDRVIGDRKQLARQLARLMPEHTSDYFYSQLTSTHRFIYLGHRITSDLAAQVHDLGEPGLIFTLESTRLYAQSSLAAHVVGYVGAGSDNGVAGRAGIERAFDAQLSDPNRSKTPLALSIDNRVQGAMESELGNAMESFQAKGAAGLVLDVNTGEIVAMVSLPTFNPNKVGTASSSALRNNVTQSVYELGSTIKPITIASAIENGVITSMARRFDATTPLQIGRFVIHDDRGDEQRRWLNIPETLVYSSNIATARIADELGPDRLFGTFQSLGFDTRPQIELKETAKPLWPTYRARVTTMTSGFGHGIAITPLQLANAYAAMVNGGILRPATLLKIAPGAAPGGKRVFSEATSARMRQLLRLVVTQGTGRKADAPGFRVGGKTGTAEIAIGGGYSKSANVSTFVGAFPMEHPRYVVLAMLDSPVGNQLSFGMTTAAWTAAPVVRRVISRVGSILGVLPSNTLDIDLSGVLPLGWQEPNAGTTPAR